MNSLVFFYTGAKWVVNKKFKEVIVMQKIVRWSVRSIFLLLCVLLVTICLIPFSVNADLNSDMNHAINFAQQQLNHTISEIATNKYPRSTYSDGTWKLVDPGDWTCGFFPGCLWLMYDWTGDNTWKTRAESWTANLESQKNNTSTHDVGFMIFCSYGNGYRLNPNDPYKQVILTAAQSLSTRYNSTVGCIKSWNNYHFPVIIDNMMNLELLLWASKNGGSASHYDKSVSHANKTITNHVRADNTTYHVVDYDPNTGAVLWRGTHQGYNDESTWARGQAWGLYGFTMAYRETNNANYLDTAKKLANYFVDYLPADYVPYWDFEVPGIPNEERDSSAAAIAASGLLELSTLVSTQAEKDKFKNAAVNIITSLCSSAYLAEGSTSHGVLRHAVGSHPGGTEIDVSLIYGDYYLLEALLRLRNINTPSGVELPIAAVTASADDGNVPANSIDNNLSTRWSADGDGQWIKYDLGDSKTVSHVAIAWYSGNTRASTFDIQVSGDDANWTTVFSGTSGGTSLKQEYFDFNNVAARYVRYLGHGNSVNTWNSITELDIFGPVGGTTTPTPTPTPTEGSGTATPTPTPTPSATPTPTSASIFFDGFESGLGNWSAGKGTPSTSTVRAHTGSYSNNPNEETDVIYRNFGINYNKVAVVWFYDDAADTSLRCMARVDNNWDGGSWRALGVSTAISSNKYVYRIDSTWTATNITRTTGWHELKWDYISGTKVDMYIDGILVVSPTGLTSFGYITMGDWWNDSRTGAVYFDDVKILQ